MKVSIRTEIDVHSPSVVASRCRPSHVRATRVAGTAGTWILHIGIKLEATPYHLYISRFDAYGWVLERRFRILLVPPSATAPHRCSELHTATDRN